METSPPSPPQQTTGLRLARLPRGRRARSRRAQVIYLVPLVVIFMITTIFLTLYTQRAVRERIQLQVLADASAHDGTLVQALTCDALTLANDAITLGLITILKGLSELEDPTTWVAAIKAIYDGVKTIKDATTFQNKLIKNGYSTLCPWGVLCVNWNLLFSIGDWANGVLPIGVPIPKIFNNTIGGDTKKYSPQKPDSWAQNVSAKRVADILWLWKSLGRGSLGERSFVFVFRVGQGSEPSNGPPLLLMSMDQYWSTWQMSWAMTIPAFCLGHDPWESTLNPFEQFYSLQVPGPWWDAHLADVISKIESSMTGYFEDKLLLKPNGWATDAVKKIGTSNVAEAEAGQEIEMVNMGRMEEDEASDVEDE